MFKPILIFVFLSQLCFAQDNKNWKNDGDDFLPNDFSTKSVMVKILDDMEIACNKSGICTISAVTTNDRRFTTQVQVGMGNALGLGLGGGNSGSGTTVILPGATGFPANQAFYGLSLQFSSGKCTQKILVPRALYIAMNRYLYGLINEDGSTRQGFRPSDEAMIIFYSTIMKQATGCTSLNRS